MGIRDDQREFNTSGLRGLVSRIIAEQEEAFIKETNNGWQGMVIPERPAPGSGPYLHYRRGFPVLRYSNISPDDNGVVEFRVEI